MADKNLLQLPLATNGIGALLYGVQDNTDKAFSPSVLIGNEAPQAANFVYAGPTSPPGALPSFRRLVVNDIPDLSALYMRTTGGALVSPAITNPTITGGNISGSTITVDDDKFRVRNALDTTKVIRFNAAAITAGATRIFSFPDANGAVITDNAPQDLNNKGVFLRNSTVATSAFRIPHGQPPATPVDGDMWTTAGGLYVRVSGVTVGPLAAEQTSYVTSFNTRVGDVTLLPTDISTSLGYVPYDPGTNQYVRKSGDSITGPITSTSTIVASDMSDSVGNLRTGTNGIDSKVSKAGDTMTGTLNVKAEIMSSSTGPSCEARVVANNVAVYWDSRQTVGSTTPNGPAVYRALSHTWTENTGAARATLDASGNFLANSTVRAPILRALGGTFATQQRLVERGWSNGVARWVDVIESDGSMSLYSYDVGAGRPTQLLEYRSAVAGDRNQLSVNGIVIASAGFGPTSDPRLKDKKSFHPINNAVEKLYNLNVTYGKYHNWHNDDGKERVFLMADEAMKQSVPQALIVGAVEREGVKYDGWSSDQIIALLVKAVQELTDEVNILKEKINE